MKLRKKTRKKLKRLARTAGAVGAAFVTELLAELTASFTARRADEDDARGARSPRHGGRRSNGTAEHEPLPRTADSH